jgi:hypothetical protein
VQIAARRLDKNEIDHELIWLGASVVAIGMAAGWFLLGLPWPRCAFHDLTGLPCVTCGMTRAAIQFFQGHLLSALEWNPLVFVALCGVAIFNGYALFVLLARAPRFRIALQSRNEKRSARIIIIAALLSNWGYLLAHWRAY